LLTELQPAPAFTTVEVALLALEEVATVLELLARALLEEAIAALLVVAALLELLVAAEDDDARDEVLETATVLLDAGRALDELATAEEELA
jgi:hypothetical protein